MNNNIEKTVSDQNTETNEQGEGINFTEPAHIGLTPSQESALQNNPWIQINGLDYCRKDRVEALMNKAASTPPKQQRELSEISEYKITGTGPTTLTIPAGMLKEGQQLVVKRTSVEIVEQGKDLVKEKMAEALRQIVSLHEPNPDKPGKWYSKVTLPDQLLNNIQELLK